jgi:thiazole synthase ThiGH ThiG subunit
MADKPSKLKIADREFSSRLLVGTGKFASNELMRDALIASGTELVTVALRRADISGKHDPFANILDFIDPKRFPSRTPKRARNAGGCPVRAAGGKRRLAHGSNSRFTGPALFASRSG